MGADTKSFPLQILTMDGKEFEGEAAGVMLRSIEGDIAILPGHINYCTGIGMGVAKLTLPDGTEHKAACIGGMVSMLEGRCTIAATTWEWSEDIDEERALAAKKRAEERLAEKNLSDREERLATAKLQRALVRISASEDE